MLYFITRRLLFAIPLLFIISVMIFTFLNLSTDIAQSLRNPRMTAEQFAKVKEAYGLDKTGPARYFSWLGNFVRGDWGTSFIYQAPVAPLIKERLKNTLMLMALPLVLSVLLAIGIGVFSAVRPYSKLDYTFTGFSFLGISVPIFWFGLLLQLFLGFYLKEWLRLSEPVFFTSGMHSPGRPEFELMDFLRHAALPSMALMVQLVAGWGRFERSSMLEVVNADYVRTARAKGLKERKVVFKHSLRNALIPLVTVVAIDIGLLFGGLIVTEQVFAWPGMGTLILSALVAGDYPLVLSAGMVIAFAVAFFNLTADVMYGILDPRIRYD
ncbi:MAG: ABC transporter permease [Actinobacteria bacterium]|nr:ABC transporter permease [Actinomycetota bacterium]